MKPRKPYPKNRKSREYPEVTDAILARRFWAKVDKQPGGCWLWTAGTNPRGYGTFNVRGRMTVASRYSFVMAHGPIPEGQMVRHTCDTPACVRPAHLVAGTHADNMKDMSSRGRACRGEDNERSVLTEQDVTHILTRLAAGDYGKDIAKDFGVTAANITAIRLGKTWAHIPRPPGIESYAGWALTNQQVREIEKRLKAGELMTQLAREYGVSNTAARSIRDGRNRYCSGRSGGLDGDHV